MFPEFLPPSVAEMKDVEAIALLQRIQRHVVDVPFEQVTHPTLIFWGEVDDVLGRADATRFEQAIAKSRLVWVEGAGHVPHFEQPQVVANHLLAFAQQTGA